MLTQFIYGSQFFACCAFFSVCSDIISFVIFCFRVPFTKSSFWLYYAHIIPSLECFIFLVKIQMSFFSSLAVFFCISSSFCQTFYASLSQWLCTFAISVGKFCWRGRRRRRWSWCRIEKKHKHKHTRKASTTK